MSAVLAPATDTVPVPTVAGPVTQLHVVRSEWTKLRALRSTWYCALAAVVMIVGVGALIAVSGTTYRASQFPAAHAVAISLTGILFAQLVIGTLGVLAFGSEYGTGVFDVGCAILRRRRVPGALLVRAGRPPC
jgi:ABC-2 type transport system permease protein